MQLLASDDVDTDDFSFLSGSSFTKYTNENAPDSQTNRIISMVYHLEKKKTKFQCEQNLSESIIQSFLNLNKMNDF